jgi:hypothetical protein
LEGTERCWATTISPSGTVPAGPTEQFEESRLSTRLRRAALTVLAVVVILAGGSRAGIGARDRQLT